MFFSLFSWNDKHGLSKSKIRNITYIIRWVLLYVLTAFSFSTSLGSPVIGRQHFSVLRRFEISQKSCNGFDNTKPGVCMFNFQCHQRGGKVIGTCIDGFLFGACCSLSANALEAMLNENNALGMTSVADISIPDKDMSNKVTGTIKPDTNKNFSTSPSSSDSYKTIILPTSSSGSVTERAPSSSLVMKFEVSPNLPSIASSADKVTLANHTSGNISKVLPNSNKGDPVDEITTTSSYTNSYNRKATAEDKILSVTTVAGNLKVEDVFKTETYQDEVFTTHNQDNFILEGFGDKWDLVSSSNISTNNNVFNGYLSTNSSSEQEFSENDLVFPTEISTLSHDNELNTLLFTSTARPVAEPIQESLSPTTPASIYENNEKNVTFGKPKNNSTVKNIEKFSNLDKIIMSFEKQSTATPQWQNTPTTLLPTTTTTTTSAATTTTVIIGTKLTSGNYSSNSSLDSFPQTGEVITAPFTNEISTMKSFTISTNLVDKLDISSELMPFETTTQEPLLFWTTRGPPTRRPLRPAALLTGNETDIADFDSTTNEPFNSIDQMVSFSDSNTYEILLQKIANNILQNNNLIWETSSEPWASSTYPIVMKNTTTSEEKDKLHEDPSFVQIPELLAVGNTISNDNASSGSRPTSDTTTRPITTPVVPINESSSLSPSSGSNGQNETLPSTSNVKPPIDLNILVQLLNLTSYIPDEDMFIPSDLLPVPEISSNELEETNHPETKTTTTIPTTNQPTTTSPITMTTSTTATTSTTTSTTTTTTTRRTWNWKATCGVRPLVREGRIVNGRRSDFGEWPWQALVRESTWLGIFTKNKCGGVLLNSKYVITAAHCQPGFLASLIVVLGELDVSDDYEPKKTIQKNVKRVVVHKSFIARTFDNDLALLELESPVEFDEHIVPICMPEGARDFVGSYGYVSGWGRLSYQGSIPNLLHNVEVPVIPNDECQDWFKEAGHTKTIKPEFICAGYKNGKKDSCEGDSGGPLSIRGEDGRWILAGIVSHGIKCAYPNLPGVYMRMSYYKPWIDKIINS